MTLHPDKKVHDTPGKQHVAFQFEAGTSADVYIHIRPPGEHTREGITTHVVYESKEDQTYNTLVSHLTKTAGRIIEHNFVDGRDDIETPDNLVRELVDFKAHTSSMFEKMGQKRTFELLRRAKTQVFHEEETINRLTGGQRMKLTEIFRWHVEDAINNPPPLAKH